MGPGKPEKLRSYHDRRNPDATPEPFGDPTDAPPPGRRFVIQRHTARRLHYDLRLERDGVLLSWAIPRGLPLDPGSHHLAVRVEDHPLEYASFEGVIPPGKYGAGRVRIWDSGTWDPVDETAGAGLTFRLRGQRVYGIWDLAPAGPEGPGRNWRIQRRPTPGLVPIGDGRPRPMLAFTTAHPPPGEGWRHELKWDGYRCLGRVHAGRAVLWSRGGTDLTERFAHVTRALPRAITTVDAVIDGEVCSLDRHGRSRFGLLQRNEGTLVHVVFDVLEIEGRDVCGLPWARRRELLEQLVEPDDPVVRLSPVFADGAGLLRAAAEQGLEGTVSKRADSRYRPNNRSRDWQKVKVRHRSDFAIAGVRSGRGSRSRLGALILARPGPEGEWHWAGNCGAGLAERDLERLEESLADLLSDRPPFSPVPAALMRPRGSTTWCHPRLVCEVEFTEWTDERRLRAPVFVRLRDDITGDDLFAGSDEPERAGATRRPARPETAPATTTGRVEITNPDKVWFPAEGITKGEVIAYYRDIAAAILPHLEDRPLTLMRYPDGIEGKRIVQKNRPSHMPAWIPHAELPGGTGAKARPLRFPLVNEPDALLWMINAACVDMNSWYSRAADPLRPDWLLFDLDPAAGAGFPEAARVALLVREALETIGLTSRAKTSSARGVHVMAPLEPVHDYEQARVVCRVIAKALEGAHPGLVTTTWAKERRRGVLIDCNQVGYGRTISSAYSVRPRSGAPVSTPVSWEELEAGVDPTGFTMQEVRRRLERHGDLFAPVLAGGQLLEPALARLRGGAGA